MSIVAQCPHCETKFNLEPEMAGKKMRCPNFDCQQVFTVKPGARPTEPPPPPPAAKPVPPSSNPRMAKPKAPDVTVVPSQLAKPRTSKLPQSPPVGPPKVKEVVWSEDTDVPPPPPKAKKPLRATVDEPDEPDDAPILRRKKKKERGPWILIGMLAVVFVVLGGGVLYVLKFQGENEELLAKQAEAEYKKPDYPSAKKAFEKLAADYPESENAPKYKFFAELSDLQSAVKSVTNRDNPDVAQDKLRKFIEANKASEFAKHTSGYGRDIYEAGKKVGEDLVAHAEDRLKKYQANRASNGVELERLDKTVAGGRELIPLVEAFKAPDDSSLDSIRKGFDQVEAGAKKERDRTAALAKAAKQLETPTDAVIQATETELTTAGIVNEPEAQAMLIAARGKLRESVKYEADVAAPRAAPTSATATVLFVSPVGPTRRPPAAAPGEAPPSVFLAVARGILYALEEDSGSLVWAVRVGPEITEPPAIARVELADGPTDLAVVTSNAGGEPAIAGYVVKSGEAKWYQPLPAPAAGPAAIIGTRAFVAIRDSEGTIYEFDLTTGIRKGRIRLGQPAGPGPVVRPGTGLLYVAADARRIYVLDAGAKDDDGTLKDPQCVQVIATGHLPGTLRTTPTLLGADGDTPGDRWMVVAQADGPSTTKIRAFSLPPIEPPTDGKVPPETAAIASVEIPVPGWVWFPPASDGERLALATDAGQFRLLGMKQPNNFDRPLFALPTPSQPTPADGTAVPGLAFPSEEAAFWVLSNGMMQKFRLGLLPSRGVEVIPAGPRLALGVPTQPPQLNNRKTAACLVVRSLNSAGSRAVLVNLSDGEIRWQRQLGVIPAAPPIVQDGGVVLAAEDGGIVAVPGTDAAQPGRTTVAPPAWVIADSPENATGPTLVTASADGKLIYTVTPILVTEIQKPVAKWLIRRVSGGQITHRGTAIAPGAIAGPPVILGESLLVPAVDGSVYRHVAGTGKANPDTLVAGPPWASDRRPTDAVCSITPTSETSFLTNDGSRKFATWNWPKSANWSPVGKEWELGERPAGAGVVLPPAAAGEAPRLLLADVTGSVWMFASDRPGQSVRRWRPSGGLPSGKPTSPFVVQADAMKRLVVTYTVENKFLVCLDPERDLPRWAKKVSDDADITLVGPPCPAGTGRWIVSDLGGRVTLFDTEGEKIGTPLQIGLAGVVPAVAAGVVGGTGVLAPLSDGSAVVLTLPTKP
ncbi:MAG: hypothetical protein C0467_03310 [Planctomycetaceae bacterium]|nr:hypothetical protein [Planctomycetaceae bacterium]